MCWSLPRTCTATVRAGPHCCVPMQATLAACNVAARLSDHPVWTDIDVLPFVDGPYDQIPKASPSIVNANDLDLKKLE